MNERRKKERTVDVKDRMNYIYSPKYSDKKESEERHIEKERIEKRQKESNNEDRDGEVINIDKIQENRDNEKNNK